MVQVFCENGNIFHFILLWFQIHSEFNSKSKNFPLFTLTNRVIRQIETIFNWIEFFGSAFFKLCKFFFTSTLHIRLILLAFQNEKTSNYVSTFGNVLTHECCKKAHTKSPFPFSFTLWLFYWLEYFTQMFELILFAFNSVVVTSLHSELWCAK